jgi:hypothetical protein
MSIDPTATLLDTVAAHPETEAVFRAHGEAAGVCILCEALFETIENAARLHGLDVERLLGDLKRSVSQKG